MLNARCGPVFASGCLRDAIGLVISVRIFSLNGFVLFHIQYFHVCAAGLVCMSIVWRRWLTMPKLFIHQLGRTCFKVHADWHLHILVKQAMRQ